MKKLLFLALLAPAFSQALQITLEIQFNPTGACPSIPDCVQALQDAEDQANAELPPVNEDTYADGISNANVMTYKGMGTDYGDNFSLFTIKASGGAGVQSDGLDFEDTDKLEGIAAGGTVTIGLNLALLPVNKIGAIEFKKLDLFFNFMSYNLDQELDSFNFKGDISAMGFFARYRLIDPVDIVPGYMLEWGGLHLHTGLQKSTMNLNLAQNFKGEEQSGSYTVKYDADAVFDIDSSVTSIPVELSTYLRAAYVFTLYGGAGFDMNMGNTDVTLDGQGDLTEAGSGSTIGEVVADGEGSGSPVATNFRAFAGLQFNVPFVRLYVQGNKMLGEDVVSTQLGAKFAW